MSHSDGRKKGGGGGGKAFLRALLGSNDSGGSSDDAFKRAQLARDLAEVESATAGGGGDVNVLEEEEEEEARIRELFARTKRAGEELFNTASNNTPAAAAADGGGGGGTDRSSSSSSGGGGGVLRVRVEGRDVPAPATLFSDCGALLGREVLQNIERCKYERPTPIQRYALPVLLQGRDMLATAQTGSGKTAAFLLPIIANIVRLGRAQNPHSSDSVSGSGEAGDDDSPGMMGGHSGDSGSDGGDASDSDAVLESDGSDSDGSDIVVFEDGSDAGESAGEEEEEEEENTDDDDDDSGDDSGDASRMESLVQREGALVSLDPAKVCYPTAIVLAPTRELAHQIYEESLKFSYGTGVRSLAVIGGASRREQMTQILTRGCDIVVATPGRLVDFLRMGYFNFSGVRYLCMDEADRMLDFGFDAQIEYLIRHGPITQEQRQTLMFSATFTKDVQYLALRFLKDYVHLTVGDIGRTNDLITQQVMFVKEEDKAEQLLEYIGRTGGLTIVFCARKVTIMQLEDRLRMAGHETDSLHGDKDQQERADVVARFKARGFRVLIATDVAARGLDVDNVEHVVNYDFPQEFEQYVHRIGRTGRAGRRGTAMTFFNYEAHKFAPYLWHVLEDSGQEVPKWLRTMARNRKKNYQRDSDMLILKQGRTEEDEQGTFVKMQGGAGATASTAATTAATAAATGLGFQFGGNSVVQGSLEEGGDELFELDLIASDDDDDDDDDDHDDGDVGSSGQEKAAAETGRDAAHTDGATASTVSAVDDRALQQLERDKELLRQMLRERRKHTRIRANLSHINDPQKHDMLLSFHFPLNLNHVAKLTADVASDASQYMRPEEENADNLRTVHLFNIPGRTVYSDLRSFLYTAGRIVRMGYYGTDQWHMRYAKVTFQTDAIATRALQYLQRVPIAGSHKLKALILAEGQVLKADHRVVELSDMHEDVTEQEIRALYDRCGKVVFVNLWKQRAAAAVGHKRGARVAYGGAPSKGGKRRGISSSRRGEAVKMVTCAYVEFADELDAQRALALEASLHGVSISSSMAYVVYHGSYNGRTVRVKGLDSSVSEMDIRQFFIHCGKVTNLAIDEPRKISPERTTALLRFRTGEEALRACWMSNMVLGRFPIRVHVFVQELHHVKGITFRLRSGERGLEQDQQEGQQSGLAIGAADGTGADMPESVRFIRSKIDSRAYDFYNKHLAVLDRMRPHEREELQERRRRRYDNFRLAAKQFKKVRTQASREKRRRVHNTQQQQQQQHHSARNHPHPAAKRQRT